MDRSRTPAARAALAHAAHALLAAGACRTLEGRYVGEPRHGQCVPGVPIVVERPRWLRVTYSRVLYGTRSETFGAPRLEGDREVRTVSSEIVPESEPTIEIRTEVVPVGEVYAVDFKRPASGTIDYAMTFEPGRQFPKTLHTKVKDDTLETLANSITSLKDLQKAIDEKNKAKPKNVGADGAPIPEGRVRIGEADSLVEYYDLRTGAKAPWLRTSGRR